MPKLTRQEWDEIKAEWERGLSSRDLAHRYPVSRQAIDERAKREAWCRDPSKAPPPDPVETLIRRAQDPRYFGHRNRHTEELALELRRSGCTLEMCGDMVGVSKQAIWKWGESDPAYKARLKAALAAFKLRGIGAMVYSDKPDHRFKAVTAHPDAPEFQAHDEGSRVLRFEFLNFSRKPPVIEGKAAKDVDFVELPSPGPASETDTHN